MPRKKLGELLLDKGLVTQAQITEALRIQSRTGKRLGQILIDQKFVSEDDMVDMVSERLAIPRVSLGSMVIDPQVIQRVSVETARRYKLMPIFAIGNTLTLAMSDPLNIIAVDEIKYQTGCEIKRAIASESEIKEAIEEYYSVADSLREIVTSHAAEESTFIDKLRQQNDTESDSPIVKLVNLIITKAARDRASDIHIEPDETTLRIRYRVSGVMHEEASPPKTMQNEVISRIKISANLDVSEKRLPQDGRFSTSFDGHIVDLRVSTLPTIHGEKIVIRILDRRNLITNFERLGFEESLTELWEDVIHKPEGLVLISGPTSSGKTSTLYATLQTINSIEKNIVTVEDPVEYSLPLINQVQINEKAGLNFPSTLRSILRQNPDILMIGEIRDRETAQMAVRSALTGHVVFSTIHTNDAPSAITRLIDMGIEPYLLASAIKGVLAQRLVRTNCRSCLTTYRPADVLLHRAGITPDVADSIDFQRGEGCSHCKNTGYAGQVGIFEFVKVTLPIAEMIMNGASTNHLQQEARKTGYVPLFEAGMIKLREGQLTLEELLKETSHVEDLAPTGNESLGFINAKSIHV